MASLDEIERAVSALPAEEFTAFRAWFERFEADRFDTRLTADAEGGRLDRLAEEALDDLDSGHVRPL